MKYVADVRCPYCYRIGAELWRDGERLEYARGAHESDALWQAENPVDFAMAARPWCTEPAEHRWKVKESDKRRVIAAHERDTPMTLRAIKTP